MHGFSPDGKKIIFSSSIGGANAIDLDVWTMELATGEMTNLTKAPGEWDEHGHFSPSGKKIAYISTRGYPFPGLLTWKQTARLDWWLMNADGSEPGRLTYFNEPGHPRYVGAPAVAG